MSDGYGYPVNELHAEHMAETRAIETILKHEGGYQNKTTDDANKNSKGQWVGTNRGITPAVYEEVNGKVPSARDMQKLTKQEAIDIYRKQYAKPIKENLGISPDSDHFAQVLDIAVNHGYSGAVAMVQRAVGAKVDGKAGPATRAAIAETSDFNNKLVDARHEEYDRIMKSKPKTSVYAKGWHKRAESFRKEAPEAPQQPVEGDPLAAVPQVPLEGQMPERAVQEPVAPPVMAPQPMDQRMLASILQGKGMMNV